MVQKRPFGDHEGDGRYSKRKPLLRTVVEDLARGPSLNEARWEDFFRRLVREEVEKAINRHFNASPCSYNSANQAGQSGGGSGLELRFMNKLPSPVFTGNKIEPKHPSQFLQIVLFDSVSQKIVATGPLSSVKVEIVALDGDFGADNQEDWTEKEFNDNVLKEREGRRPLVTGELTVTLSEGVGFLNNVVFTDNSSWLRSRKFRLGARVSQRVPLQERIKEARSEAFVVKDQRGELYRKHHPPYLKDEVWRLEKIAKDGAFHSRLAAKGINTVREFLQLFITNPSALRETLGGLSDRIWTAIVEHAMKCVMDDNRFFAFQQVEHDVIVFFDSICNVVGASFNGTCLPVDALSPSQKILVDNLKQYAYKNVSALVPVDCLAFAGPSRPIAEPSNLPSGDVQPDFPVVLYDQPPQDLNHEVVIPAPRPSNHVVVCPQTTRMGSFSFEDFQLANFNIETTGWSTASTSQMPFIPTNHLSTENFFPFQGASIPSSSWNDQGTSLFITSNNNGAGEEGFFSTFPGFCRRGKAKWSKVRTALKCLLSVKHAGRKMGRPPLHLSY